MQNELQVGMGCTMESNLRKAAFAGGCFWHVEADFRGIKGVVETAVGYEGGNFPNPRYEDTHDGKTGHAETVEITYDQNLVTYGELLEAFWEMIDPTALNRQGPDKGSQYRSVVFYFDQEQKKAAEESKARLGKSGKYGKPIVTEVVPASKFWRAEEYHQRYFEKHGMRQCRM
jgi:peptide-methionine (S)-S-oxide reductase